MEKLFTWKNTYSQLVKWIEEREHKQSDILDLLKDICKEKLEYSIDSKESVKMVAIDPFTFFSIINKYKDSRRLNILQKIYKTLRFQGEYPEDVNGLPRSNAQKSWLVSYKDKREDEDIPILWELFKATIKDTINNELFTSALAIKNVGLANLTAGLFYINPYSFIPINAVTKKYFKILNIDFSEGSNKTALYSEVASSMTKVIQTYGKDSFAISAGLIEINTELKTICLDGHSIYKISHGIGTFTDNDYNNYLTRKIISLHKDTLPKGTSTRSQAENFKQEMKIGDYFFLCRSNDRVELLGRVTSNSEVSSEDKDWLERNYDIIAENKEHKPHGTGNQWWHPSNNSTFIKIPIKDLDTANQIIFKPCFGLEIQESCSTNSTNEIKTMANQKISLNQILYGPPGTGKTYNTINKAIQIINPSFDLEQDRTIIKEEFNRLVENGSIRFVTFHQSFSYEDFVEGIKPVTVSSDAENGVVTKNVVYELEDGVFKQICKKSENNFNAIYEEFVKHIKERGDDGIQLKTKYRERPFTIFINSMDNIKFIPNTEKESGGIIKRLFLEKYLETEEVLDWAPYLIPVAEYLISKFNYKKQDSNQNKVLIIDEINRGNIASIFGELITLIEEDKREDGKEALSTILPYSKENFSVPSNVYILGTMNTADRSVEALDIALRRRFSFIEMAPDSSIIKNKMIKEINLRTLLDTINLRIEKLLDKDHKIGHAYFMNIESLDDLIAVFADKVIPLLEEYFFGDYSKIGLVLGSSFVMKSELDLDFSFADFDNNDLSDLLDKPIYELTKPDLWDFKSIL